MTQGLADRLKEAMGAEAKESSAPSLRELQSMALRIKLILAALSATVDDKSEDCLNLAMVESAHRLARRLDEALDLAAG